MAQASLLRLIESLRSRLDAGDEMIWERSEGEGFVLRLATPPIAITVIEDDAVEPPKFTVTAKAAESADNDANSEERLVSTEFLPDSEGYADVRALCDSAKSRFASISELLEQGANMLEADSGPIGGAEISSEPVEDEDVSEADTTEWAKAVTGDADTAAAVEPTTDEPELVSPTEEQVKSFFERIKGNWKRHHEQGFDELAIDGLGDVYYRFTEQGKTVSKSPKPAFRLVLLACTPELSKVELSREAVNGTMRQIEVLRISENEMVGHAKHDHQLLQYRFMP
jgi:ketosteroid isomerase-like protein